MAVETIPAIGTEGKYLDRKGLAYFWSIIKGKLGKCVTNVEYKGDGKLYKTIGETESEVVDLGSVITAAINDAVGAENKAGEATITLGDKSIKFFVEEGVLKTTVGESTVTLLDVSSVLNGAVTKVGFDEESGRFTYTTVNGTTTLVDATPVMELSVDSTTAGTNVVKYTQAGSKSTLANVALTDHANTYTAGDQNFQGVHTTVANVALDDKGGHNNDETAANTKFVNAAIAAALGDLASAMVFRGGVSTAAEVAALTKVKVGDTYVATGNFTLGTEKVETGDLIIAKSETPDWVIVQKNEDAVVSSTATSTLGGEVALFDGTTGKAIKASAVKANADGHLVDTTGNNTDLIAWKAITTDEIDAICEGNAE